MKTWRIEITRTAEKQITKLDRTPKSQSNNFYGSDYDLPPTLVDGAKLCRAKNVAYGAIASATIA